MSDSKFRWSWLSLSKAASRDDRRSQTGSETSIEVPWLNLAATDRQRVPAMHSNMAPVQLEQITFPPQVAASSNRPKPRWVSEHASPYSDFGDDGSGQQPNHATWRHPAHFQRNKRFVARGSTQNGAAHSASSPLAESNSAGSTWMLQLLAALALAGCGIYAHSQKTSVATELNRVYQNAYSVDYSSTAGPALRGFLTRHHIAVPSFLTAHGGVSFELPMQGEITKDYGEGHPQIVIQGTSKEQVLADGSGKIAKVVTQANGVMVTIDHGSIVASQYFGLGQSTVKVGDTVNGGEVIGRLPDEKSPILEFGMTKNGAYVNPHDFIHFSNPRSST